MFCAGALEISGLWGYNIMQHEALGTVASDNMEPDGIAVPVGYDEDAWVGPEIRTLQSAAGGVLLGVAKKLETKMDVSYIYMHTYTHTENYI